MTRVSFCSEFQIGNSTHPGGTKGRELQKLKLDEQFNQDLALNKTKTDHCKG